MAKRNPTNEKPISLAPLSLEDALRKAMNAKPAKAMKVKCPACGHVNPLPDRDAVSFKCEECGKKIAAP